jgi:hypothetical protein
MLKRQRLRKIAAALKRSIVSIAQYGELIGGKVRIGIKAARSLVLKDKKQFAKLRLAKKAKLVTPSQALASVNNPRLHLSEPAANLARVHIPSQFGTPEYVRASTLVS